jgi:uncharacterized protein YdaU (DUF1376 family)
MAEFPALPLFTDAYLGDTIHLTTIEHGAYLLLLICMWRSGGKLPNNDKLLARFTGLSPAQWRRIKPILWPFFDATETHIMQGRLTDELTFVKQHSKKQSDNAKARWLKIKENNNATAYAKTEIGNTPHPHPTPPIDDEEDSACEILTDREIVLLAMGHDKSGGTATGRMVGNQMDVQILNKWRNDLGLSISEIETVIRDITRQRSGKPPPVTFSYFNNPMQELAGQKASPKLKPIKENKNGQCRENKKPTGMGIDPALDQISRLARLR